MMEERGVHLDHSTLFRWVQRYAPEIEKRLRWAWRRAGCQAVGMSMRLILRYAANGSISTGL